MTGVFPDTSYYIALLLEGDEQHVQASQIAAKYDGVVIISSWVMSDLASFLSPVKSRALFLELLDDLQADPSVLIVPIDAKQFDNGLALYSSRLDKSWSLVDCISFLIMKDHDIVDAWTTDHHFEQAGFRAILT